MNALPPRLTLVLTLALNVVAAPAVAHTTEPQKKPSLRPSYDHCLDQSQGVTVAINNCVGTEYDFQDQRLNTAYKALLQSLSESRRSTPRDQERAWIADRDKSCAPPANGGTADMLGANECRLDRTALRAEELEAKLTHPLWPLWVGILNNKKS